MTPRPKRTRLPVGLRTRGDAFVWEVRHPQLRGERMVLSMRTDDVALAIERMSAVRALMERGDWRLVEQIRAGELHITQVVAAVRDGAVPTLRRNHHDRPTLGPAIDAYLHRVRGTKSSGSQETLRQYQMACRMILAEWGPDQVLEELTVAEVEAWLHRPRLKRGKPWSPRRQNSVAIIGGALWGHAIEAERERSRQRGYTPSLTDNPWKAAKTPEVRETRHAFLTVEEWRHLFGHVQGTPEAGLLACAFLAGLRAGEILNLRTDIDVLLDDADPRIVVQSREGWEPKNRRGERDVPMCDELVEILTEHRRRGYSGERYFFRLAARDDRISYDTASAWVKDAFLRAGIRYGRAKDGITWHSGRRTFASWLAQDEVPLNIVADLLGDTLDVTYRTYAKLVPTTRRTAVARIDKRLGR